MGTEPSFTVLGASGSIGSALCAHLKAGGQVVYAPARGETAIFKRALGHVIYCVGLTADFRSRPLETVDAHVGLLADVLEQASYETITYLSSTRVYRGLGFGDEGIPLAVRPGDPDDLYNLSKLLGESLCLTVARNAGRVVRLSNVIGPGAHAPSFAVSLVRDALEAGMIRLEGHPNSVKDYVDIRDAVELLPLIATEGSGIYNLASGVQTTHGALAETIASLTGCSVESDVRAAEVSLPPISTRRVMEELLFAPRDLRDSLADMISAKDTTSRSGATRAGGATVPKN